ncbi:MAG: EamA family transporter, partial [Catenulispora sp.]|nr:EamA family transporter [Catenulispora sp.]
VTGLLTDGTAMLRVPTAAEAAGLLYLALPLTVGAFLLWYRALNGLGPQRAGLLIGVVPVSACAASAALGVGTPGIAQLAGVAVVVAGIVSGLARSQPGRSREVGRDMDRDVGRDAGGDLVRRPPEASGNVSACTVSSSPGAGSACTSSSG